MMNSILVDLRECKEYFVAFLRHPVQQIRHLPDWTWQRILTVQVAFTMLTGILSGLVSLSVFSTITQAITVPILTLIMLFVSCFFFYYAFQIFLNRTIPFRSLFTTVFFANVPFFIFQIAAFYFSPISLVGFAFTALLLIVAFVDNYKMPKKIVIRLIGSLYVIFMVIWIIGRIDGSRIDKTWQSPKLQNEAPEVKLGE